MYVQDTITEHNEQGSTYFLVEFEFEWLSRQYVIDINKRKIFQVDVQYKRTFQKEHGVLLLLSGLTSNNDATIGLVPVARREPQRHREVHYQHDHLTLHVARCLLGVKAESRLADNSQLTMGTSCLLVVVRPQSSAGCPLPQSILTRSRVGHWKHGNRHGIIDAFGY